MKNKSEVVYLSFDEAQDLVARIADRCEDFDHTMVGTERIAMAQLLSDIGVKVSDLIDVSDLADNYAINAERIAPEDYETYGYDLSEALFSWEEDDGTHYCLSW